MFGANTFSNISRDIWRGIALFLSISYVVIGLNAQANDAQKPRSPHALAQTHYEMGSRYRLGIGIEKSPELALDWFTRAANKGSAKGQYAVAWMLAFSEDEGARDYLAALPWLLKASGPHPAPHESGYRDAQKRAEKKLKWMCRKGVVEFPDSHPFSKDPTCLLARGNRLFHGRDKLSEVLAGSRNYGVEKDYVQARKYLERALESGEKKAAVNLAKIHKKGLGTDKDETKFEYYLQIAGETNDGETNYYLAERANKNGNTDQYIERLKQAAVGKHSRASKQLGHVYFKGDIVEKDTETALMYYLLGGHRNYAKSYHGGRIDTKPEMVAFYLTDSAFATLETAKARADDFAKEHKFRRYGLKNIEESYSRAKSDLNWVKETNGVVPFKNTFGGNLFYRIFLIFCFGMMLWVIRSLASMLF